MLTALEPAPLTSLSSGMLLLMAYSVMVVYCLRARLWRGQGRWWQQGKRAKGGQQNQEDAK